MTALDVDPPEILAAAPRSNAELVVDLVTLGHLHTSSVTLDPTWGLGRWWKLWQPTRLVGCDLDPERSPCGRPVDFTQMPWPDGMFDVITFDPPYKLNGTASRGGPASSDGDYGVGGEYVSWQDRHQLIRDGITECVRVLKPGAGSRLVVKCQDQVCGGRVRWQTHEFTDHAEGLGLRLVEKLHVLGGRAQPPGRDQQHARRNYSTALVFTGPPPKPEPTLFD